MGNPIIWTGKYFRIRLREGYGYRLERFNGAVLDCFEGFEEARAVAIYCEDRGGSYEADVRKAAKLRYAQLNMPVAPCPMNAIEAASPQAEQARMRSDGGAA